MAPQDCTSIYEAIDIEDAIVSNCIVDQLGIESILLIPSDARAIELMSDQRKVPRNCSQGITIKGAKYFPDPNYRTYGSRYHRAQYLQVDTKDRIWWVLLSFFFDVLIWRYSQIEQAIACLIEKKSNLQNQFNVLGKDVRDQTAKKNELEQKIMKLNKARAEIRRQLDDLKTTAEPEVVNLDILVSL